MRWDMVLTTLVDSLMLGMFYVLVAEVLRDFGQYETLGYGFILVLALLFMSRGICGLAEGIFRSSFGRRGGSQAIF